MSDTLSEKREELAAKRDLYKQVFDEAAVEGEDGKRDFTQVECLGTSVNQLEGAEKAKRVAEIAAELKEAITELDVEISTAEASADFDQTEQHFKSQRKRQPFASGASVTKDRGRRLSFEQIAKRVVEDPTFKAWQRGSTDGRIEVDASWFDAKALMSTTAGFPPEVTRTGVMVDIPLRPPQILDILPRAQTGQNSVAYMQQDTRTQAAVEIAEGTAKPEATFVWSEVTTPVQEIAVSLPVTDVMLDDAPQIASLIETQLREDIQERLDGQSLNGNGTSPNLRGILNHVGVLTQSGVGVPMPDAIKSAGTAIQIGAARATPTHVVLHPTDWDALSTLKEAGAGYIFGNPGEMVAPRIWGWPIVVNEELPAGTALVGGFSARNLQLYERRGISVARGFSGTDFVQNRQTLKAFGRWALAVYRPAAFITITGFGT